MTAPYRYLRRTAKAGERPVAVEDAKKALRIEHALEDDVLGHKLDAAEEIITAKTNRVLRPTDYELTLRAECAEPISLGPWPIRDVESVEYRDSAGVWQAVADADFEFVRLDDESGEVRFYSTFTPSSLVGDRANMRIVFSAGYGDAGEGPDVDPELELPARVREVLLMLAGHFFEHREAVTAVEMAEVPLSAGYVLEELRIYR